jgi:hypothetical protein
MCDTNFNQFEDGGGNFWLVTAVMDFGIEMMNSDLSYLVIKFIGNANINPGNIFCLSARHIG